MPAVQTVNTLEESQVDPVILQGLDNAILEVPDSLVQADDNDEAKYTGILNDLDGEFIFSKRNVTDQYDALTSPEFAEVSWPLQYFSEIVDDDPETSILAQSIKDAFLNHESDTFVNQQFYEQHVIFKNILFNLRLIYILTEEGWREMTFADLTSLYGEENKFYLAKFYISERLKYSLNALGGTLYNKLIGISHYLHDIGYKYFIVSSEPISLQQYLEVLPQTKESEADYYDGFDSINYQFDEFEFFNSSFTSLKSNYVFQSTKANMSLVGFAEAESSSAAIGEAVATTAPTATQNVTGY